MGNEEVDLVRVVKPEEKRSLLQKFDIPVEHLSYEYITECTNVKEVERIVQILRSGEEGIFPDLIEHGEKCLEKLSPNSKVLRVEEPALTRAMLEPEDRKIIDEDIAEWMNDMQGREKDLEEGKALSLTLEIPQPEIRRTSEASLKKSSGFRTKISKQKSIASCDYEGWDKFDADAELDRMDLRDERKQVEAKDEQKKRREEYEGAKKLSRESIVNKLTLTATELSVMAEQEKNIGNEAYRAGDYEEALIRYNSSISINSNINGYNNRAITNIKLKRYQNAIDDCNVVLSMEYTNVTALMRRGLALEHLEKKSEALVDYQTILQLEPNNKIAIAAINKLRKPSDSKKVRMKIEEEDNVGVKTQNEVMKKEEEIENHGKKNLKDQVEINFDRNRGLSKICFCDRAPGFSRSPKPPPHYKNSYCISSLPNSPRKLEKHKIIGQSKSQHSYFSDMKINGAYKLDGKSDKLIIEELPSDESIQKIESRIKKDLQAQGDSGPEILGDLTKNKNSEDGENLQVKIEDEKLKPAESKSKLQKIDVATKYEKSSISKTEEKTSTENFDSVESPYEFLHIWQSLKNDTDLSLHAKLLRSLKPEDLITVIGNKLDGNMFSMILRCLDRHFCSEKDVGLIHRFITSLTKLSRFSIVRLFMDSDDKKVFQKILNFLKEEISSKDSATLREAYNI